MELACYFAHKISKKPARLKRVLNVGGGGGGGGRGKKGAILICIICDQTLVCFLKNMFNVFLEIDFSIFGRTV